MTEQLSAQEIRERAERWFARQLELLQQCHGRRWPRHREWIEAYLREEIRVRLVKRGWRPRR